MSVSLGRWQLLPEPITLDEFNIMPKLTSMFFEYGLELETEVPCPLEVVDEVILRINAFEVIRYKVNSCRFFSCRDQYNIHNYHIQPF